MGRLAPAELRRGRSGSGGLGSGVEAGAGEVAAAAGLADELTLLHDHLAAQGDDVGKAAELLALIQGVVDVVVDLRVGPGCLRVGTPDDRVGVAAPRDGALVRVDSERLGAAGG